MKDNKWIAFLKKHSRKFIAFAVALSLLLSLSGISAVITLVRNLNKKASTEATAATTKATEPTESTAATADTAEATTAPSTPKETLSAKEQMEQSVIYLNEKIEKDATNPELFTKRAALHYNLGNTEEAINDYTSALALKEDPETRYLRAIVYTNTGNDKAAYQDLTAALQAAPDNENYLSLMADTCNALQRYAQALECLEKLLVKDPDNCVLRTLAGDACVYLGDFKKAAPHYEKAIAVYSDKAAEGGISKHTLYSAYGNTLKTLERFAEAATAYSQSLKLKENKELYFQKGFCLLQNEKYTEAIQDFTKCIELGYEKATACFQRALCYYATADYSNAIADFTVYEAAFPDKTDSYLYMGLCHQNLEQYEPAITYYQKCLDANISAGVCHFNIANCYYNQKENSKAVNHYTEAIKADSYLYESLLNRGVCYIRLNKYNEAKADLKRVIDECKDASLVESATKSYDPIKNITIITKG